jgi:outer membrane protein, heavy metal efflux system
MRTQLVSVSTIILLLTGCAVVPSDAGFGDVQREVLTRTGQRVRWYQGAGEDAEVRRLIDQMLGGELTGDQAVQIALLNNRGLQAVYEDLGVSQAAVVQAGLLRNPVLDGNVKLGLTGPGPEFEVTLAQNFLDVLYIPMRKAVAEADFETAKLRVAGAVLDLAARVRSSYYRVQADTQMIELLEQVVKATGASYDAIKRLHAAGNVRDLDVDNERAQFERAKLNLSSSQAEFETDRERLNTLMGLWGSDTQWTVAGRLPDLPGQPMNLEGLERAAVSNSLDLAEARQDIEAFGRRVGLSKATALVPELEFGAAGKREAGGEWLLGPAFTLPIPLFDQGQARIAAAQAELRRRQQAYIAQAVQIRSAVRAARQRVLTTRRIAEHYRDVMLPLSARVVNETQLQYNAMQVGVFQLLSAKERQINAGQEYIRALHDYWVARTELETILQGRVSTGQFGNSFSVMAPPAMSGANELTGGH